MMSTNGEREDEENSEITHGGYRNAQQGTTHLLAIVLEFSTGVTGSEILPELSCPTYAAH